MQIQRPPGPTPPRPAPGRRPQAAPLRHPVLPPPRRRPVEDGRIAAAIVVFSGS